MLLNYPECRFVSAKTGEGIDLLKETLENACAELYAELEATVSENDAAAIALISKLMQIFSSRLENGNLVLSGKILKIDIPKLEKEGIGVEIVKNIS